MKRLAEAKQLPFPYAVRREPGGGARLRRGLHAGLLRLQRRPRAAVPRPARRVEDDARCRARSASSTRRWSRSPRPAAAPSSRSRRWAARSSGRRRPDLSLAARAPRGLRVAARLHRAPRGARPPGAGQGAGLAACSRSPRSTPACSPSAGPAVLFENVEGSAMPVLTNLFGTVERVAWGMNREPHQLRELGETAGLPQAAGAARRLARGARDGAAAQGGAGDEAEDRRPRALPGGRAARAPRSTSAGCRSRPAGRASRRR